MKNETTSVSQKMILWLFLSLAFFLMVEDIHRLTNRKTLEERIGLHQVIVSGESAPPYRYRILVHYGGEWFIQRLTTQLPYATAFWITYAMYYFLVIYLMFNVSFMYFTIWLDDTVALIGVLYIGITLAVGFRHQFYPYSFLEVVLFTLALHFTYRRYWWALAGVIFIGSLNRETAIFYVLACALNGDWTQRKHWLRVFAYGLIWFMVYAGIRYVLGQEPHVFTLTEIWYRNTETYSLYDTFFNVTAFFGPFLVWSVKEYKHAPSFLRHVFWIAVPYLLIVALFGMWWEVRLLMFLYPLFLPIGLLQFNQRT